jgi:hypothetical protein
VKPDEDGFFHGSALLQIPPKDPALAERLSPLRVVQGHDLRRAGEADTRGGHEWEEVVRVGHQEGDLGIMGDVAHLHVAALGNEIETELAAWRRDSVENAGALQASPGIDRAQDSERLLS